MRKTRSLLEFEIDAAPMHLSDVRMQGFEVGHGAGLTTGREFSGKAGS